MGDVRRKHNLYSRPRKMFDSKRIEEENQIQRQFGLKSKKEIWKTSAKVSLLRNRAKKLIPKTEEEKQEFFERLNKLGLEVKTIADVLALKTENLLNRRLQTILVKKELAKSPLEARQLITHKNVFVNGRLVNIPSFIVTKEMESKISLKPRALKETQEIANE